MSESIPDWCAIIRDLDEPEPEPVRVGRRLDEVLAELERAAAALDVQEPAAKLKPGRPEPH
jgi:hypothetical protein